jgi:hypothetical protein
MARNMPNTLQNLMSQTMVRAATSRQFSILAWALTSLAKANHDSESIEQILAIKERCTFPFETFCRLYLQSFVMPLHRSIRFMKTGKRYYYREIGDMAEQEFVVPLTDLMVEMAGKLGETQEASLENILISTNQALSDAMLRDKKYNIVFDNEDDLEAQMKNKKLKPDPQAEAVKPNE